MAKASQKAWTIGAAPAADEDLTRAPDAPSGGADDVDPAVAHGAERSANNDETLPEIPPELPALPIREIVVFPGTVVPLTVGREKSKRLIDSVLAGNKLLAVFTQRRSETEDPRVNDLYRVGTACQVLKLLRMPDGANSLLVHGLVRLGLVDIVRDEPFWVAHVEPHEDAWTDGIEVEALVHSARQTALQIIELSPNVPDEAKTILENIDKPGPLADFLSANLSLGLVQKQELLETFDVAERLRKVNATLNNQLEVLQLSAKIQSDVRSQIDKSQRQYYLQEQMRAIQKELGEADSRQSEIDELRQRILAAKMPDPVRLEAEREVSRLERVSPASPESGVIRDYVEWLCALPWEAHTADLLDLQRAEEILDADHYGLSKVKRRILEFLAVRKLNPAGRSPILCFVGPPGVGKTSLGQSIARALGRQFIRIALGGVRDEADIRGHRRTYIGSIPGRIIQEIRKAGVKNPVIMLDELDKLGQDFRGDPAAALLEVLDPSQNHTFTDHYLGVPFDLSKVVFIATANYLDPVPPALLDRLEVIELSGYTAREKIEIAQRYLVPRQLADNGLAGQPITLPPETILAIIDRYTREAGVRNLERAIGSVCRGLAARVARSLTDPQAWQERAKAGAEKAAAIRHSAEKPAAEAGPGQRAAGQENNGKPSSVACAPLAVTPEDLEEYLGPPRYERENALTQGVPGVVTGLAYTPAGGDIIFIEATKMPGRGGFTLTGQIGDVMRESATAALSLVRARAQEWGLPAEDLTKSDVHIHVPAGGIPKDGPSAGVAMTTALVSLLSGRPADPTVGMTGEITLRGLVLPIGGVREKVLSAHRAGLKTIILPARNRHDLVDVPADVREQLRFVLAERMDQVLEVALAAPLQPAQPRREPRSAPQARPVRRTSGAAKQRRNR